MSEQEEKLPPWQIKDRGDWLMVTDGIVGFMHRDSVSALRGLAEASSCWPNGTAKATAFELKRADHAGFKRGQWLGLAVGTLLGIILSTIAIQISIMVWS